MFVAYLLNRLRMPKAWRTGMLAVFCGFVLTFISLGQNYTGVRFLAPFVLLLAALRAAEKYGLPGLLLAPFACVTVSCAISPEMGFVSCAGVSVAFGVHALSGRPRYVVGVLSGSAGLIVAMLAYGASGLGMFGGFYAGGAHFPVLLSSAALLYVATVLLAGWGVGATTETRDLSPAAAQLGWFAACLILVAAAFGRADFVHVFWNGAAAFLLVSALLWRVASRFAPAYPIFVGVIFITSGLIYAWSGLGTGVVECAVRGGWLTQQRSVAIARVFGRPQSTALKTWRFSARRDVTPDDLAWLLRQRSVLALYPLNGEMGKKLATSNALAESYAPPWTLNSRGEVDRQLEAMSRAKWILVPTVEYKDYLRRYELAKGSMRDGMWVAPLERGAGSYAAVTGFPLFAQAAFPTLDNPAVFGQVLSEKWRVYKTSGDYTILEPLP
jgi:hypothetical protein